MEPRILHADYLTVMIPLARYNAAAKVLRFQLVVGDKAPEGTTVIQLANCQDVKFVLLAGKPFGNYKPGETPGSILLTAPQLTSAPQVWGVHFAGSVVHI